MKKTHIHVLNGTGVFQSILLKDFQSTFMYTNLKNVYSVCLQEEVKSVLLTQVPDNSLMLITEQVFLFDYSNNHNNRAMSKYSDVTDSTAEKCST